MERKPLTVALEDKDDKYFRGAYHRKIAVLSDIILKYYCCKQRQK